MEKIIDRIRKLLSLARDKGASENEAAVALSMAQRLMLEHNITHLEDEKEEGAVKGNWMGVKRGDKWENLVSQAAAKLFNCRVITNRIGDYYFAGKRANIEACEMTFTWICEQVEALYKQGLSAFRRQMGGLDKRERADFRTTFKEACALRIFHRAAEIVAASRNTIPDHKALVVIDQSLAQADELIRGIPKGRSMSLRRSGFGTGAGAIAGDQVKLRGELK